MSNVSSINYMILLFKNLSTFYSNISLEIFNCKKVIAKYFIVYFNLVGCYLDLSDFADWNYQAQQAVYCQ